MIPYDFITKLFIVKGIKDLQTTDSCSRLIPLGLVKAIIKNSSKALALNDFTSKPHHFFAGSKKTILHLTLSGTNLHQRLGKRVLTMISLEIPNFPKTK